MRSFRIDGSWSSGEYHGKVFESDIHTALQKCKKICEFYFDKINSFKGGFYVVEIMKNFRPAIEKAIYGLEYNDLRGYHCRKIRKMSQEEIEEFNNFL